MTIRIHCDSKCLACNSRFTFLGMNKIAIRIKVGTIMKSSNWPSTGIKSGIMSIGEIRYAIAAPINHFDKIGVRGSDNKSL